MENDDTVIEQFDKRDSITLKRNAKGDMAWDIKLYFNRSEGEDDVLAQLDDIHERLTVAYT